MSEVIEALLLTKSAKMGGSCVAGIRCDDKSYIRFVSNNEQSHGALTDRDMTCADGYVCRPLDVVRVPVEQHHPIEHQPENWLIDTSKNWELVTSLSQEDALDFCDGMIMSSGKVFGTKSSSVSEEYLPKHPERSLELIRVEDLVICVLPGKKYKVNFKFGGNEYKLMSMTDRDYFQAQDGYVIGDAVLLVSLPSFDKNGEYYKFVAKIFPIDARK